MRRCYKFIYFSTSFALNCHRTGFCHFILVMWESKHYIQHFSSLWGLQNSKENFSIKKTSSFNIRKLLPRNLTQVCLVPVQKGRCFSSFPHKFPTLGEYSKMFTFAQSYGPYCYVAIGYGWDFVLDTGWGHPVV